MKKAVGIILFCLIAMSVFSQSVSVRVEGISVKSQGNSGGQHVMVLQNSTGSSKYVTILSKIAGEEAFAGSGTVPANGQARITLELPYSAKAIFVIK